MAENGAARRQGAPQRPAPVRIQSIGRAKALLDAMGHGGWVGLGRLAETTGLAKTTTFNLVTALVDVGLAEHDGRAGAYRLSLQHVVYGKAVERRLDIAAIAGPHLIRLCAATRETVNLALPAPTDCVIVESLEGSQSLRVSSYSGTRAAYHATACGRALLAHQPDPFRQVIYGLGPLMKETERTVTDPDALEALLAECRSVGYATEFEENEIGGACVAAPIFGPGGEAIASVSIAGPSARFGPATMKRFGALLVESLAEVTKSLTAAIDPPRSSKMVP
ncbi:IclR family transcriptional regulator [Acuticoccus sp. M5D2P5]|uniref:IclR family transcriptional regulator n=1 Tax=Acuticoccus kalidii TaxID=2910977 RepID=UPI001F1ADFE2|nr:IclR family transcriptional regulator [Acuticoccus kalidii]MCF3934589.1 IclR family transcriptional regulator [Acuticoccus kalidii]